MRKIERACRIISSGIDANRLYFTHVMRFDGSRISLSQIERRTTHRLDYYKMRVYYFVIVELVRAEIQWNDNAISIWWNHHQHCYLQVYLVLCILSVNRIGPCVLLMICSVFVPPNVIWLLLLFLCLKRVIVLHTYTYDIFYVRRDIRNKIKEHLIENGVFVDNHRIIGETSKEHFATKISTSASSKWYFVWYFRIERPNSLTIFSDFRLKIEHYIWLIVKEIAENVGIFTHSGCVRCVGRDVGPMVSKRIFCLQRIIFATFVTYQQPRWHIFHAKHAYIQWCTYRVALLLLCGDFNKSIWCLTRDVRELGWKNERHQQQKHQRTWLYSEKGRTKKSACFRRNLESKINRNCGEHDECIARIRIYLVWHRVGEHANFVIALIVVVVVVFDALCVCCRGGGGCAIDAKMIYYTPEHMNVWCDGENQNCQYLKHSLTCSRFKKSQISIDSIGGKDCFVTSVLLHAPWYTCCWFIFFSILSSVFY